MIDIILPVYNALEEVQACLASVCRHTPATLARVLLIDDASSDPRVQAWLEQLPGLACDPAQGLSQGPAIEVLRNPRNLGFVATVNRGMALGTHDVVLLNSDTVVSPGWLERMLACADSRPDVATVTPFSNNAEICSYPVPGRNTRLGHLGQAALVQALADCDDGTYPQLPTAVGFCMFIRRRVLHQVGLFDAERFGRGYGEENEFCLRASAAGFVHLLCTSAWVVHHGGRSFGADTQGLRHAHLQVLLGLYPDYNARIADFVARDPVAPWRLRVMQRLQAQGLDALGQTPRPAVLMVTHALGGGVEKHVQDLLALLGQDLRIEILRPAGNNALQLEDAQGNSLLLDPAQWPAVLKVLRERGYQRVHLHHWAGHPPESLHIAAELGLPLDVTVHDFGPLCPQFNLSGPQGTAYCGEPALAECERCVQARPHPWGLSVTAWREQLGHLLAGAVRVWAPSQFVAQRLARHWPQLSVEVLPHPPRQDWLDWLEADTPRPIPRKVLVLGGLSPTKGLQRVREAAAHARIHSLPLHFVLVGYTGEPVPQWPALPLTLTGEYVDADLPELLQLQDADVVWFPSEIPETWSYTLDVALASGLPIVSGDGTGALAERLQAQGWPHRLLAPQARADEVNPILLAMADHAHGATADPPAPRHAYRERRAHYRQHLLAANAEVAAPAEPLVLQGHPPLAAPVQSPPQLSLSTLFTHGVLCGHGASRQTLQARLREADQLAQDLSDLAAREGAPWYEHLAQLQSRLADEQQTRALLQQAHTDLTQAHTDLTQALADLQLQHRELEARSVQLQATLQQTIDTYEHSRSWRWTAPLRDAGQWLRQTFPGLVHVSKTVRRGWQRRHMARQILREQGLWMLVKRAWGKLQRPQAPRLSAITTPSALAPIGPLQLDTCPGSQRPLVSLVIPVYGQHLYTFNCLRSLGLHTDLQQVEVILVDDCSPEPAEPVLRGVEGVQWLRNATNLGFIGSCNAGAARARGEYVLLLNNDVQVTAGWLHALLRVFALRPDAGMAGARLVYPDGTLQEAGGVLWRDGSAWNWGRGQDPENPAYKYLRAADYCSGACLLLRLSDWQALGGFDAAFAPAYYEDTDLAFRLRALGKQVIYQPDATVVHYEGITSGTDETQGVKKHQVINQKTFFERWQSTLAAHQPNGVHPWREVNRQARQHMLVVDHRMITPDMDSGSVRMQALLEILTASGVHVTYVAENLEYRQPYVQQLQQTGIEVWYSPFVQSVLELIERTGTRYDTVMLCRHHIAAPLIDPIRRHAPQAKIWFDTVDLHYLREERQALLEQSDTLAATARLTKDAELNVIRACDLSFVVSPVEQSLLAQELPHTPVEVLSNIHEPLHDTPGFALREGLLFVGGFEHPPNVDAVIWFVREVWPLVRAHAPDMRARIVGSKMPDSLRKLEGHGIEILGFVQDIEPLLAHSRISIAPLRYGAGVKGKVNQAMSHGLPVVATPMAVEGMNLVHGTHVLVGDTPETFAAHILQLDSNTALWERLAAGGKDNVREHFSRDRVRGLLSRLLNLPQETTPCAAKDRHA